MATFYTGRRYVLKGRSTANAVDPYTGRVGDYGNYLNLYSPDHVFDGFPDNVIVPGAYNPTFGNARADQNDFSPMKNAGDAAGAVLKSYDYRGVPSTPVLSGTTGWSADPYNAYFYFGLSTAAALPTAGITNAPGQINYYGDYISDTALKDPKLTPGTLQTDYDILQWKGVPSAKAL